MTGAIPSGASSFRPRPISTMPCSATSDWSRRCLPTCEPFGTRASTAASIPASRRAGSPAPTPFNCPQTPSRGPLGSPFVISSRSTLPTKEPRRRSNEGPHRSGRPLAQPGLELGEVARAELSDRAPMVRRSIVGSPWLAGGRRRPRGPACGRRSGSPESPRKHGLYSSHLIHWRRARGCWRTGPRNCPSGPDFAEAILREIAGFRRA